LKELKAKLDIAKKDVIGHCDCEVGGQMKTGIPMIKDNIKTVWVLYKGKVIKRHKEKHCVRIC